jgi:hypothetical protein
VYGQSKRADDNQGEAQTAQCPHLPCTHPARQSIVKHARLCVIVSLQAETSGTCDDGKGLGNVLAPAQPMLMLPAEWKVSASGACVFHPECELQGPSVHPLSQLKRVGLGPAVLGGAVLRRQRAAAVMSGGLRRCTSERYAHDTPV